MASSGFYAVHATIKLHHVEIKRQYAILWQDDLGDQRKWYFHCLAHIGSVRGHEQVLDQLLRNGRSASTGRPTAAVVVDGLADGVEVDSVVLVESAVFGGDRRMSHMRCDEIGRASCREGDVSRGRTSAAR